MLHRFKHFASFKDEHKKPLFLFSLVAFFWTVFDSIMTYVTPLLLQKQNVSLTMIGLFIGSSSVTGALFDFLMTKLFRKSNFRRVILFMFVLCFLYPVLLWNAKSVWLFLLTMSVWAIYCDLYGFGLFNFVQKFIPKKEYANSFGVVQVFRSLARIIAPLLIGFVLADALGLNVMILSFVFLGIGFLVFLALLISTRNHGEQVHEKKYVPGYKNLWHEIRVWKTVGKKLFPALYTTFFLFVIEAFFWTLAPVYGESMNLPQFGGLFLTAYLVPPLFMGWLVQYSTNRYGKKRTAFVSLLLGSGILSLLVFFTSPIFILALTFVASCFIAMATPAVNGVFADVISEAEFVEVEIEGLADSGYNIGYIVGPILAGVLADTFHVASAFSLLGVLGILSVIILLLFTPKHLTVKAREV